jgi:hypothetical protein
MFNDISAKIDKLCNHNQTKDFFKFEPQVQFDSNILSEFDEKRKIDKYETHFVSSSHAINSFNFEIHKRRISQEFTISNNNISLDKDNINKKFECFKFDHIFKSKDKQKCLVENFNHEFKMKYTPERLINLKSVMRFRDISSIKEDRKYIRNQYSLEIGKKENDSIFISTTNFDQVLFKEYENIFTKIENVESEYDRIKSIMKKIMPYNLLI